MTASSARSRPLPRSRHYACTSSAGPGSARPCPVPGPAIPCTRSYWHRCLPGCDCLILAGAVVARTPPPRLPSFYPCLSGLCQFSPGTSIALHTVPPRASLCRPWQTRTHTCACNGTLVCLAALLCTAAAPMSPEFLPPSNDPAFHIPAFCYDHQRHTTRGTRCAGREAPVGSAALAAAALCLACAVLRCAAQGCITA